MKNLLIMSGLVISSFSMANCAAAQSDDEICATAQSKICGDMDANICFDDASNWDKLKPECIGYTQTMIEMANEAHAEMLEDPIAPVHGNSDEDNEMIASEKLSTCLQGTVESGDKGSVCVGQISDECLEQDGNYSTADIRQCISLEYTAWDDLLNQNYKALMSTLESEEKKSKLRDAQRLWIKFSDQFCALGYEFNQGTAYLIAGDQCKMEMTAQQSLALKSLLTPVY